MCKKKLAGNVISALFHLGLSNLTACFPFKSSAFPALAFLILAHTICPEANAGIEPGETAFSEMNCIACHAASPVIEQRLASRKSPLLGLNGSRLSPTWTRDFLINPQTEQPGARMPDMLHSLSLQEKTEAAEALTHYLISLQPDKPAEPARFDASVVTAGKELFHKVGCVACHAPQELPADSAADVPIKTEFKELATNSVPLGNLSKKFNVEALAAFLRDPLKTRPSGRMPAQRLSEKEAWAISMYLLRDQPAFTPPEKIPGLNYEYYENLGDSIPDFSKLAPFSAGYTTNPSLASVPHKNSSGLRFRALLTITQPGDYTFWTTSADGSQLFIDGQKVVDNDGIHRPIEKDGSIKLTSGDHTFVVNYLHHEGHPELKVSWAGPGLTKQEIPATALSLADNGKFMHLVGEQPFALDSAKVAKGQQLFETYNCASCHELNQPGRKAAPLEKLAESNKGCLAANPPAGVPAFVFSTAQRLELASLLTHLPALEQPLSAPDQVNRTMATLNCYACHSREGVGAPTGLRRTYFTVNGTVDLGEEGALPPHLNGVGMKLRPQWMEKVLFNGASVRPYMATRMPQFGEANVRLLINAFQQADASQRSGPELSVDAAYVNGLRLVGTEGLSCIICHTFAGHPSLGVPAIDLLTAPERLNSDWFRRYLLNPALLRPGTRMPSFWPNGVAANKSILNGDTEKQIAAIWSYLAGGKAAANLPPGLIHGKMELLAKTEPRMYRNFIQGAGPRAIGVGYPEKVNLAYDANQMSVALLWQGAFMDASRHWTGRGEGFEPPMGYSVVKFPSGAPFAVISDPNSPWPKAFGKEASYQFRGYAYDALRRPQFHYQMAETEVSDVFLPEKVAGSAETGFRRKLALRSNKPVANLWFRAAVAEKLEDLGNRSYLVDGTVRLAFPAVQQIAKPSDDAPMAQFTVRKSEGKFELLVPVAFQAGNAEITEEISW